MTWQEIPLVRILAPYVAGVLLGKYLPGAPYTGYLPAALITGLLLLYFWQRRRIAFGRRVWFGAGLSLLLGGLGFWVMSRQQVMDQPGHFSHHWKPGAGVLATVLTGGAAAGDSWEQVLLDVVAVESETGEWRPAEGRLLTYQRGTLPKQGDTLLLRCRINRITSPPNPLAFDYARYMGNRGIFHQAFVRLDEKLLYPFRGRPGIRRQAEQLRHRCLRILNRHLSNPDAFAVGAALVLGYREALEDELRDAYAQSGAIHILAVSGLHVGLVYLAFSLGLRWLPRTSTVWRLLQVLIQLAGIWGFVLLAGLPPSAVRAATMFSFFVIGRVLSRDASVYNILAAAAFCMLIIDPRLLFDVGFQLSYAAVLGIVSWQGSIYRSLYLSHPAFDYFWKLISVSLAAQLATFPLSLYYFNQFPLLFWLSGLIAVPAASLILGGGISLLLLSEAPWLGKAIGQALQLLISTVNVSMSWISALPGSRISGLWIDAWVLALWYALILAVVLAFYRRRGNYWVLALGLLLVLLLYRAGRRWFALVQRQLVVYMVSGHSLIDLLDGYSAITISDSLLGRQKEAYAAEKFRWYRQVTKRKTYRVGETFKNHSGWYEQDLLQFYHFSLLILGPDSKTDWPRELEVDAVLIRGDPAFRPEQVLSRLRCRQVIIDASCSFRTAGRWRRYCDNRHLRVHDLRRDGAFVFDLNRKSTIHL